MHKVAEKTFLSDTPEHLKEKKKLQPYFDVATHLTSNLMSPQHEKAVALA